MISILSTKNIAVKKILILTANPKNTDELRLNEEVREIQEGLQRSRSRDQFEIIAKWAVRPRDLSRALLDHAPQIVHFSGHGAGCDGLVLESDDGQMKLVSTEALARLFKLVQKTVECVVLNACYSEVQAVAIQQHIDYVIGMSQAIGNQTAIKFSMGFYDALGANRGYGDAFEFGLAAIDLEGIPEAAIPSLKQRNLRTKSIPINRSRIFISYKQGREPDESLAIAVSKALSQYHDVFTDQIDLVGRYWVERIEAELGKADFLIVFLSQHSVNNEMLKAEIEAAHYLAQEQGTPVILPVFLTSTPPIDYLLSTYLNDISWASWGNETDTPKLIQELQQAILGDPLSINTNSAKAVMISRVLIPVQNIPRPLPKAQPLLLEIPGGTMDADSRFYVERSTDAIALNTIEQTGGVTMTIKGPRQMGKSSLFVRVKTRAEKVGKRVIYLDFQSFDRSNLQDCDQFYLQFCEYLTDVLDLENRVAHYWQSPLGNSLKCSRYVSREILKSLDRSLVLVMDEVELVLETSFRADFFGMLRSWHNNRAIAPVWKKLDLVLITSTEPYQLIDDLNQSPFNVGQIIDLVDFDTDQIAYLNQQHNSPLNQQQLLQLIKLLAGQPYLIRLALYRLASGQISVMELFAQATSDNGPFGDHLRYHLFQMNDKPELREGFLRIIRQNRCDNESVIFRLQGAGLVRREAQVVLPRCQLYATYFQEHFHD